MNKKSLFGRVQGAAAAQQIKKSFAAKVLKSGGPPDLVEQTFAGSLEHAREEELPPAPPEELPEANVPKNYKKWTGPVKNG